ncbi:MAG: hypothetical protein KH334_05235, partial [Clostridiales bacterium]|nr:hypothetical protein [Clostridiales bacterium]
EGDESEGLSGIFKEVEVEKPGIGEADDFVEYYRVQGGTDGQKRSKDRIHINDDGTLAIADKEQILFVSKDREHAEYFLKNNREGGEMLTFKVPKWLDDFANEYAIPDLKYNINPKNQGKTVPRIVDPKTPGGGKYGYPAPWIEWIEEYGYGGRIL